MKLSFLFLFFALQACLFDESKGNRSASSTEANEVSTAEAGGYFSYYESYFQQNGVKSNTQFSFQSRTAPIFLLGRALNDDLINFPSQSYCLKAKLSSGLNLITAASPLEAVDLASGEKVYYLHLDYFNETLNKQICSAFANPDNVFTLDKSCSSNCPYSEIIANSHKLYFPNSSALEISLSHLSLNINVATILNGNATPGTLTCNINEDCDLNTYDCCQEEMCVTNGQVKEGVDEQSLDYINAFNEIITGSKQFSDYPLYFYSCP
ncbi:MAG: hypothetical protein H6621_01140 [Halobacteriovoraceae bacterium]|nr:hypothetical protein [Halobacteriovoraceae bacterium]MCB9093647.1 hypothetical protein [Halobacteriovoraceae bacterium]